MTSKKRAHLNMVLFLFLLNRINGLTVLILFKHRIVNIRVGVDLESTNECKNCVRYFLRRCWRATLINKLIKNIKIFILKQKMPSCVSTNFPIRSYVSSSHKYRLKLWVLIRNNVCCLFETSVYVFSEFSFCSVTPPKERKKTAPLVGWRVFLFLIR